MSSNRGEQQTQGAGGRSIASIVGILAVVALVVIWIFRNGGSVEVDWLITTTEAPLALVIIVAGVMGWVIGSLTMALVRRRRAKEK